MKKFALLIGVNRYNFLTPLNFAVQDAECTAEALKSCYGFQDHEICLMTDSKNQMLYPSRENVQKQIQFLKQNHDLDLLIVGFWGHSFAVKADERYLCAILTQEEDLVRTGLPLQQVIAELKQVQALNTCLILDCCQSRAGGRGEAQSFAGRAALSRDIVLEQRPVVPGQRRRVPTMAVLNACDDQEKAYEWDEKGHGLFTKFLLDGLNRRYASLAQLASYVTQNVADTAQTVLGKTQNPFVVMQGAGDIPLLPAVASPVLPPVAPPVLPPPPPQIRDWWYCFPRQSSQGPVLEDDFLLLIQSGQIVRGTLVWTEGRDWVKVESVPEFAKYYKDVPIVDVPVPPVNSVQRPTLPPATDEKGMVEEFNRGLKDVHECLEDFSMTAPRVVRQLDVLRAVCSRLVKVREENLALWNRELDENRKEGMREDRPKMVELKGKIAQYSKFLKDYPRQNASLDEMVSFVQMIVAGDRLVKTIDGVEYAFRWCPAGSFQMGSGGDNDEKPIHTVNLTRGFWMLETQVTQRMWKSVTGTNPSNWKGDKLPVEQVSWNECQDFCKKLRSKGLEVSLPTEAQWEYACRAGSTGDYAGNLDEMAWYSSNSGSKTHEVGLKKPNAWGLYDMHGNVWEWCADWFGSYDKSPASDPTGPATGSSRVFRGGSWDRDAEYCRSASRGCNSPDDQYYDLGVRLVLAVSSSGK